MDNGYAVGYLDDGEFVEVGRFNNLDAVANSDLEIRHADSETRVVLGGSGFDFDSNDVTGISALEADALNNTVWVDLNDGLAAVQSAVDDVGSAGGGVVRVSEGHTVSSGSLNITDDNVWVIGQGYNTFIEGDETTGEPGFIEIAGEEGDRVENSGIANLRVENGEQENVEFDFADECHAIGIWSGGARGEFGDGIDFDNCVGCTAMWCFTYDNAQDGVHISFNSQGCLASHCVSYRDGAGGDWGGFGINSETARNNIISNCVSIESQENGFSTFSTEGTNKIVNCAAYSPANYGLRIRGERDIFDVSVFDSGHNAVTVGDGAGPANRISATVVNAGNNGLNLNGPEQIINGLVVDGVGDLAISALSAAKGTTISNFHINNVSDSRTTVINADEVKIKNGVIKGDSGGDQNFGIRIDSGDNCRVQNVDILDNGGTGEAVFVRGQNNHIENVYVEGWNRAVRTVSDSIDTRIFNKSLNNTSVTDQGVRTVQNGWGKNEGDPSAEGDWLGEGYEGVNVRDTTNEINYAFVDGEFVTL